MAKFDKKQWQFNFDFISLANCFNNLLLGPDSLGRGFCNETFFHFWKKLDYILKKAKKNIFTSSTNI